jgi:agmatinase
MEFDPDAPAAPGRLFGLPHQPDAAALAIIPVPWQATTSYGRGTRHGPTAVLRASAQVDLWDADFGDAWRQGIALLDPDPRIERWDEEAEPDALRVLQAGAGEASASAVARVNKLSVEVNASVRTTARTILARGGVPAVLGGDHSAPLGLLRALEETAPGFGILHIDAHADLREAYEGFTFSHASIMHNVLDLLPGVKRLVQVGLRDVGSREAERIRAERDRVVAHFDSELAQRLSSGERWATLVGEIVSALPDRVYVSFDIDGLDPALCPATGTPVPGGLSFRDVVVLLRALSRAREIVGFDLCEVGSSEWDGNVGARVLYKLCGATLASRRR